MGPWVAIPIQRILREIFNAGSSMEYLNVVTRLSRFGRSATIPGLIEVLNRNPDTTDVRLAVVRELGRRRGNPQALDQLKKMAQSDEQAIVREAAATEIPQPLIISTTSLPSCQINVTYSAELRATGGTQPHKWSLDPITNLPAGLVLKPRKGAIFGRPAKAGISYILVRVTDKDNQTATQILTLTVN